MSGAAAPVADATGNWVDTLAPRWSRPYLRLSRFDRPIEPATPAASAADHQHGISSSQDPIGRSKRESRR